MATTECSTIILDAMALMDGEQAGRSPEEVAAHLSTCGKCAAELEQLRASQTLFAQVHRAPVHADLWPMVAGQLTGAPADRPPVRTGDRSPVGIAAVLTALVLWRAFELAAVDPLAWWSRLVVIALATVLFVSLRANPFRVEPRLI